MLIVFVQTFWIHIIHYCPNITMYEKNIQALTLVLQTLGWGNYLQYFQLSLVTDFKTWPQEIS